MTLVVLGLLCVPGLGQEDRDTHPASRWYDTAENVLPKRLLPTGEIRKVYLLEEAASAKVRDTLGRRYPGLWLSPHPTMNGMVVTASPVIHAALALDLPSLDVVPPSPMPVIRYLARWPDRLDQLPEYLGLVVAGCSYMVDPRKTRLVIIGSSPSIRGAKEQLAYLGKSPYALEVYFVTTGLSELTWERLVFGDRDGEE